MRLYNCWRINNTNKKILCNLGVKVFCVKHYKLIQSFLPDVFKPFNNSERIFKPTYIVVGFTFSSKFILNGNDKTGCTIINRVFIIIFQCKKAIYLTVYTHPIQSAMSHSDYFSACSFLLVSVWISQSHLIIKAEDLKMFYAQSHWEAFLYFLKRFLFQKYSQAISISFYIKHAWKNFEETLETHFLGAHTIQTVLKQFWMLQWKCLYLFFPLLSFFVHYFSNVFICFLVYWRGVIF